jgi:meso-butanediol dehydrogenase/(S,S)-butanediol dehydrogenase/diacetyl reductase
MGKPKPAVLITGGGTGIGAAVAARMAEDGYDVCVTGRRPEPLQKVASAAGGVWTSADLSSAEGPREAVEFAVAQFGRLDALVLNAGVSIPEAPHDVTVENWNTVIATNLSGAFFASQAALPHLIESRGSIVSVASVGAIRASASAVAYNSAKAGMVMMTQSFALEYGSTGLRANTVCPGWIRTDMANRSMDKLGAARGVDREGAYRLATQVVPAQRPGTPEEIADVVAWLASPGAAYVNGATIVADGGGTIFDPHFVNFDARVSWGG